MLHRPRIWIAALTLALLASALSAIDVGESAPDFTLPEVGRSTKIHLADYRGKVVLVDFWATWCAPCVASIPAIEALSRHFAGRPLAIVSVSADRDVTALQSFLARRPSTWPQAWDWNGRVCDRYGIHWFPTFLVLDRQGKVAAALGNPRSLQPAIEKALAAMPRPPEPSQPTGGGR